MICIFELVLFPFVTELLITFFTNDLIELISFSLFLIFGAVELCVRLVFVFNVVSEFSTLQFAVLPFEN